MGDGIGVDVWGAGVGEGRLDQEVFGDAVLGGPVSTYIQHVFGASDGRWREKKEGGRERGEGEAGKDLFCLYKYALCWPHVICFSFKNLIHSFLLLTLPPSSPPSLPTKPKKQVILTVISSDGGQPFHFSMLHLFNAFLGYSTLSAISAVVFFFLVEAPFGELEKLLFSRLPEAAIKGKEIEGEEEEEQEKFKEAMVVISPEAVGEEGREGRKGVGVVH